MGTGLGLELAGEIHVDRGLHVRGSFEGRSGAAEVRLADAAGPKWTSSGQKGAKHKSEFLFYPSKL